MTPAQDRRHIVTLIAEATAAGASLTAACAALGLSPRTLQRWNDPAGGIREDRRPDAARPVPRNKLSEVERDEIVAKGEQADFETIFADVKKRDERDMGRADSPLKPAQDAHLLDTSEMSIEAAFEAAREIIDAALMK